MPELPEVETTLRGIKPNILNQKITDVIVRHPSLRWPIPVNLKKILVGKKINRLYRRSKYILFECDNGTLILHLGMSGRLRILNQDSPAQKHDHVEIHFTNHYFLRFTDPRRFGALLFTQGDPNHHKLLKHLGVEPLTEAFDGDYLWQRAQRKKTPVKSFIMNSHIVVGVGNIYAAESLFRARIHPQKNAGAITRKEYSRLANAIKFILKQAIEKGGTTLKDFTKSDGTPGYFSIELQVYGKSGNPCQRCHSILKSIRIANRSTVYCDMCTPD